MDEGAYAAYKELGGSLPEDAFNEAFTAAESYVKYLIGFNAVDTEAKKAAYNKAVMAAVDTFANYGIDGSGFTIGSFTIHEKGSADSAYSVAYKAVAGELLKVGLLWGGVA